MATIMKLLTIADGFGDSIAVPDWYPRYIKWPDIIKLMTRGVDVVNLSRYGAGNEYIAQCLRNNYQNKDAVLIQWAQPDRLDLVLDHNNKAAEHWKQTIASDKVYNNNIVNIGNDKIWISSGSKTKDVIEYHEKFISKRQHQIRSQLFVDYAKLLLANIQHGFLLTKNSAYLQETVVTEHDWFWHKSFFGMCEFRFESKYASLDLGLTQPIPLIHFDFIRQFIQPKFNLPWRSERDIQTVENMLYKHYNESAKNKPQ
jgi:hypothetical protein